MLLPILIRWVGGAEQRLLCRLAECKRVRMRADGIGLFAELFRAEYLIVPSIDLSRVDFFNSGVLRLGVRAVAVNARPKSMIFTSHLSST